MLNGVSDAMSWCFDILIGLRILLDMEEMKDTKPLCLRRERSGDFLVISVSGAGSLSN